MYAASLVALKRLSIRVDFAAGCSIGPGKIALLEAIVRDGSLSQAARSLEMSYRRAWVLIDELNRSLAEPAVSTAVGGTNGGGAAVTPFGLALIKAYRAFEKQATGIAAEALGEFGARGAPSTRTAKRRRAAAK
jgi:molybdate transport system regulatory protein